MTTLLNSFDRATSFGIIDGPQSLIGFLSETGVSNEVGSDIWFSDCHKEHNRWETLKRGHRKITDVGESK